MSNMFVDELISIQMANHDDMANDGDTAVIEQTAKPQLKKPSFYQVILLNDDYTPMDFVVYVLKHFFKKTEIEANQIMLDVHHKGIGIAGVYSFEIAETKVMQVNQFAKTNQYPLKSSLEEAE